MKKCIVCNNELNSINFLEFFFKTYSKCRFCKTNLKVITSKFLVGLAFLLVIFFSWIGFHNSADYRFVIASVILVILDVLIWYKISKVVVITNKC